MEVRELLRQQRSELLRDPAIRVEVRLLRFDEATWNVAMKIRDGLLELRTVVMSAESNRERSELVLKSGHGVAGNDDLLIVRLRELRGGDRGHLRICDELIDELVLLRAICDAEDLHE
ncbi:MAG: hypothetical protein ABI591_34125 [Kofleriaceae bacterium]